MYKDLYNLITNPKNECKNCQKFVLLTIPKNALKG